jgi:hypothetical protein
MPVEKRQRRHSYFKDQPPGRPLLSGLPLPKDGDGVVRNVRFLGCLFHPNCGRVKFEGCEFVDCDGEEWILAKGEETR